ncbi:MAG: phosphoribosylanthranilate isomerase [Desulfomonile tiedjei]|nr:phosphoribosylanthranilate isomerase [Desulfomonile tiedjei]
MVRVKICGITSIDDALAAASFGADALGFIFAESPRRVNPDHARSIVGKLPPFVLRVGLFVNEAVERIAEIREYCGLHLVQLHGDETEEEVNRLETGVIKVVRVGGADAISTDAYPTATLLLDTYSPTARGGTGKAFDWSLATGPAKCRPIILAGGLTPENVTDAVRIVNPYAVDVSSGVESEPGRKDHEKLARFIRRAKTADRPA